MINWETIKSLYNDKPTLLEWLKKVEAALAASVLQVVDVEKVSTSEIKLNFIFEDGTNIETPTISLPYEIQSVAIINGHLILTLESGETLDAGNLGGIASLSVDANQHLIVTYQDGTTNDLGSVVARLENIEDAQGHKRFQEWNLSVRDIAGFTNVYAKASLSGTHLMIVLAGTLENGTTLSDGQTLANFTIPSWIAAKIIPVWAGIWLERKLVDARGDDWSLQTFTLGLSKGSSGYMTIANAGSFTLTADRSFRAQFDLLIDNA